MLKSQKISIRMSEIREALNSTDDEAPVEDREKLLALILGGEYLGAIDVENGGLRLLQAYSWDITGGADPRSWHYSIELPGPSGNETRSLPAEGVVEDAAEAIVATCVPPGLAFGTTDGTAAREAIRRWFHTSVSPVGRQVEAELRTKLEMPGLTLSFPALEAFASDTVGKARTVGQLVAAGLEVEDALVKAGFDLNQED